MTRRSRDLFGILPFLVGGLILPAPASAALERTFLYFPETTLIMTPATLGLDYEEVLFNAADGTRLHGWYLPGEKGRPLVLFCHGNAGNISHRVDNLKQLRARGYAVFIFDYRGYGQSEGEPNEAGTYSDARGALDWLRHKGWTPERMIYFGRSLGGGIALQLAVETPPAGLVLESAFTSIAEMGRAHYPLLWRVAGWLLSARYANREKIARLKTPLLLFHGEADQVVPFAMGRQLFDTAPQPKTFHPIAHAGHNNTYDLGGAAYWQEWRDFSRALGFPVTTTSSRPGSE